MNLPATGVTAARVRRLNFRVRLLQDVLRGKPDCLTLRDLSLKRFLLLQLSAPFMKKTGMSKIGSRGLSKSHIFSAISRYAADDCKAAGNTAPDRSARRNVKRSGTGKCAQDSEVAQVLESLLADFHAREFADEARAARR